MIGEIPTSKREGSKYKKDKRITFIRNKIKIITDK